MNVEGALSETVIPQHNLNYSDTKNAFKLVWENYVDKSLDSPRRRSLVEIQKAEDELYERL